MSYGVSAMRLDLAKEARIRAVQFFGIPGTYSLHEIVSSPLSNSIPYLFTCFRAPLPNGLQVIDFFTTRRSSLM